MLNDKATIPTRATGGSAGYDVYAVIDTPSKTQIIMPHEQETIGLGFSLEVPNGYFCGIFARSGTARKKGLRPSNCVGVVDSDYRGEVMISLRNDTEEIMGIEDGERIGQIIFIPFEPAEFAIIDNLSTTERGNGGFGSTGEK